MPIARAAHAPPATSRAARARTTPARAARVRAATSPAATAAARAVAVAVAAARTAIADRSRQGSLLMRSLAIVLLSLACLSPVKAQVAMPSGPTPLEYIDAKRLADADEKSVTGAAHDAMLAAQRKLLDEGVVACSLGKPQEDFSGFTIVMALDASGHVQRTWREGGSPLAICLQRYVRDKLVFVPPRAPFHTSLAISFTR
jgi:hypothetical protein